MLMNIIKWLRSLYTPEEFEKTDHPKQKAFRKKVKARRAKNRRHTTTTPGDAQTTILAAARRTEGAALAIADGSITMTRL